MGGRESLLGLPPQVVCPGRPTPRRHPSSSIPHLSILLVTILVTLEPVCPLYGWENRPKSEVSRARGHKGGR